jgi:hypothetical protein
MENASNRKKESRVSLYLGHPLIPLSSFAPQSAVGKTEHAMGLEKLPRVGRKHTTLVA